MNIQFFLTNQTSQVCNIFVVFAPGYGLAIGQSTRTGQWLFRDLSFEGSPAKEMACWRCADLQSAMDLLTKVLVAIWEEKDYLSLARYHDPARWE